MQTLEQKYIPGRIRKARKMAGYSMQDLATLLDISPQAVSQFEVGRSLPGDATIRKMTDILNFPFSYFSKPMPEQSTQSAVLFRANKNITKKQLNALEERGELTFEIFDYLAGYVEFPKVRFPDIVRPSGDDILSVDEIDDITYELRQFWGIPDGPIEYLSDILHSNGVLISRITFQNRKIDAFSRWRNARPFIFLSSNKSSMRTRFDLAHELGHLILHSDLTPEDLNYNRRLDDIEKEANRFAASLLLQSTLFFQEVLSGSIDRLLMLKKKWLTSVSCMIYTIADYGYLSARQVDNLKDQMRLRNMWRKEPYDEIAAYDKPYIFERAFETLIKEGGVPKREILDSVACSPEIMESFFDLPEGYFAYTPPTPRLMLLKQ